MGIVALGATGYTGRLVVAELVSRGVRPVLAGRSRGRLEALAAEHGGLDVAVADTADPAAVRALVSAGDVLLTTVGPFTLHGGPALQAALDTGAHYLDSTGEAAMVQRVFRDGSGARGTLLTACGYDFVPGLLAGALALQQAPAAAALDIVYSGLSPAGTSSGTKASGALAFEAPTHARRDGRLVELPPLRTVREFEADGRTLTTSLFGGTEPYAFEMESVSTWLDLGATARTARRASFVVPPLLRLPVLGAAVRALTRRGAATTGQGPTAEQRAGARSLVLGIARDAAGAELARVRLTGPDPYDLTASLMAWCAMELAAGKAQRVGATTPLAAFGLPALRSACDAAGLRPG